MAKLSQAKISVLNEFENRRDDWHFSDFERALEKSMGKNYGNYQTAKTVIIEAHKEGKWPKTIEQYIKTNHKSFGSLPTELVKIGLELNISEPNKQKAPDAQ